MIPIYLYGMTQILKMVDGIVNQYTFDLKIVIPLKLQSQYSLFTRSNLRNTAGNLQLENDDDTKKQLL